MTALRHLRLVAFLEGLSFVVLLFIAMPLKHFAGMPLPVRVVGSVHGILFVAFLVTLFRAANERGWQLRQTALGLAASVLPFGTFLFDRILRREIATAAEQRLVAGLAGDERGEEARATKP